MKELVMPIFEFRCGKCDHVTAFLEKAGVKGGHACEKCGSKATEKVFSTFAAQVASPPAPAGSCPRSATCGSGSCPLAR
jgi:putative FmdB family regulatory protein